MFFSIFCKISVPLFFMIAGALILKKDADLKTIWLKKITRIVIALIGFSAIAYIGLGFWTGQTMLSLADYVEKLYTNQVSVIFWYLYIYCLFNCTAFLKSHSKDNTRDRLQISYSFIYSSNSVSRISFLAR